MRKGSSLTPPSDIRTYCNLAYIRSVALAFLRTKKARASDQSVGKIATCLELVVSINSGYKEEHNDHVRREGRENIHYRKVYSIGITIASQLD